MIVFRTDASTRIGSGHVMRCLALARTLSDGGEQISFVCREDPGNLVDTIAGSWSFDVQRLTRNAGAKQASRAGSAGLDWEDDAVRTAAAISGLPDRLDWLVVDHYALDARWEKSLRPMTRNLMVIDDLADRPHDCDVLLDQNFQSNPAGRYDSLIPPHCRRLLGPRYALLRAEFRVARAKLRRRDGAVRRLLVFFGGPDAGNETAKALNAIAALAGPGIEVDVIAGANNPHLESIRSLAAGLPHAHVHHDPDNVAELMAEADLAVGATGATTWERCCLGLPSIMISLAPNQEPIARALARSGLAVYLGKSDTVTPGMIAAAIEELINDPTRVQAMADANAELADGRGTDRVARALDPVPVTLRAADMSDCETLYRWRNAEETRRYFHHPEPIALATHRDWMAGVLKDRDRSLLVGERDGEPVGVLRYDCNGSQCAVSIYLVPGWYGRGIGPRLLSAGHAWLRGNRPGIRLVRAEVLDANHASIEAFLQTGYSMEGGVFVKRIDGPTPAVPAGIDDARRENSAPRGRSGKSG